MCHRGGVDGGREEGAVTGREGVTKRILCFEIIFHFLRNLVYRKSNRKSRNLPPFKKVKTLSIVSTALEN